MRFTDNKYFAGTNFREFCQKSRKFLPLKYVKQVGDALKLGLKLEEINIHFRLITMKPLHAKWLVKFFNHITSASGSSIIINVWKDSGIIVAIQMDSAELPSLDPFQDITTYQYASVDLISSSPQVMSSEYQGESGSEFLGYDWPRIS